MVNLARSCWRKKGYSTSKDAQHKIRKTFKKDKVRLYKYMCSSCGEYHVTKQLAAKGKTI